MPTIEETFHIINQLLKTIDFFKNKPDLSFSYSDTNNNIILYVSKNEYIKFFGDILVHPKKIKNKKVILESELDNGI